ncbi:4Fe-4S dicluster domain-containing protein [Sporomusa sp.]|uniref:4Fe-4S dicluster domain-containing protein n=1 Tax=Sporomusa sp. TaxID=2078658 RepID=UPI002B755006|nr:4Fe-4S dicluster domain-containing protein [Sporomusa sp.]HWR09754.1 4Fe-4S dicluster domain-containing protein [Sporomusa sp.]
MSGQISFQFRQDRCIGCATCQVACKEKNQLPAGILFRKVLESAGGGYTPSGRGLSNNVYAYWLSTTCKHCQQPLCAQACPAKAITKRPEDGIVFIEQEKCTGCRHCITACPYGAPQYDPTPGKVKKCNFCDDLLARREQPACVDACPMRALAVASHKHG